MINRKTPLIWTILVSIAAVSVIAAGYLFNSSVSGGRSIETAVSAVTGVEQVITPEKTVRDDGSAVLQPPAVIEDDSLTTGRKYGKALVEEGSRNILILGEDKVSYLYDTLGILSIDRNGEIIKIIMIPRDTYVQYNQKTINVLAEEGKAEEPGIYKINYTHHIGTMIKYEGRFNGSSISFLADVVEEKFGVHIDEYIKVNLAGFKGIIDILGGVEMSVPYDMNYDDPVQDLHIHLTKGVQVLDGEGAEGFSRFRKGYKEDGTFFEIGDDGRKNNQIKLIKAVIKQHGTVRNIKKIPDILKTLGKNVKHSIGLGDVLQTYMGIARDIVTDEYKIESEVIETEQIRINGSAYVDFKENAVSINDN